MQKDIKEMIEKIKSGQASQEESLGFLKTIDFSLDALKILLQEVKIKQTRQSILEK